MCDKLCGTGLSASEALTHFLQQLMANIGVSKSCLSIGLLRPATHNKISQPEYFLQHPSTQAGESVWPAHGGGGGGRGLSSAMGINGDRERFRRPREGRGERERDLDRERDFSSEYNRLEKRKSSLLQIFKTEAKIFFHALRVSESGFWSEVIWNETDSWNGNGSMTETWRERRS